MGNESRTSGETPSTKRHRVEVLRMKKGESRHIIGVSPSIRGINTHYHGKKSHYCPGQGECGIHRVAMEYKGYIAALVFDQLERTWKPYCLEVPAFAETEMRPLYQRGQEWRFERGNHPKRANPTTPTLEGDTNAANLFAEFDIIPILRRFYNAPALILDAKNTLPAMVFANELGQDVVKLIVEASNTLESEEEEKPDAFQTLSMLERFKALKNKNGGGK